MVDADRDGGDEVRTAMRELDALLDGIGHTLAVSSSPVGLETTSPSSGSLYIAITSYWPRIATGLVVLGVVLDFVIGKFSVGGSLEFYVFAWASTTGGLWFMFDKAEKALSPMSRATVVGWLGESDLKTTMGSIPSQFAMLFDKVFGERHLSVRSFARSSAASVLAVGMMLGLWVALRSPVAELSFEQVGDYVGLVGVPPSLVGPMVDSGVDWQPVGYLLIDIFGLAGEAASVLVLAVLLNLIPDYLSLWETRLVLGWMAKRGAQWKGLLLDLALTTCVSLAAVFGGGWLFYGENPLPRSGVTVESGWGTVPISPSFYRDPDCVSSFRGACDRQELGSWGRAFTYPEGTLARTSRILQEIVTLEPRFGDILLRVVPTVPHVVLDDDAFARWPDLEPPEVGAQWLFDVRSIEQRGPPNPGLVVTGESYTMGLPFGLFFYSAFFTSAWLWLYASSVLLSRLLLRMNNGVGFLIRVTDVERQPFRSMGFVSVIIVSVLFVLGLPLVLLG